MSFLVSVLVVVFFLFLCVFVFVLHLGKKRKMFYCTVCGALFGNLQQLMLHQQSHSVDMQLGGGMQPQYASGAMPNLPFGMYPMAPNLLQSDSQLLYAGGLGGGLQRGSIDSTALTRRLAPPMIAGNNAGYIIPAKDMYMNEQLLQILMNLRHPNTEVERLQAELSRFRQQEQEQEQEKKNQEKQQQQQQEQQQRQIPQTRLILDSVLNEEKNVDFDSSTTSCSLLGPATYALTLDYIDGLDIQIPLEDISIAVDEYRLLSGLENHLLESVRKRYYASATIEKANSDRILLSLKDPLEFTLRHSHELHVLIITFTCRETTLFWASLRAHKEGMWITALRRSPVDVSTCLETTSSCLPETMLCGAIQADHSQDVFVRTAKQTSSTEQPRLILVEDGKRLILTSKQKLNGELPADKATDESRHEDMPRAVLEDDGDVPKDMKLVKSLLWNLQFDSNGTLILPRNFKTFSVSRSRLANLSQELKTEASVLLQIRPDGVLPDHEGFAGHGKYNNEVNLNISFVTGIPLNAVRSRVLVYLIENISLETVEVVNKADNPAVLLRPPDEIQYSTFGEGVLFPTFNVSMSGIFVAEKTHALVIIEYVTSTKSGPIVFGHASFPIHLGSRKGNFLSRIRLGDPRRPEARDIHSVISLEAERNAMEQYSQEQKEDALNSQALYNSLFEPPGRYFNCCPCGYIMWSLDSDPDSLYFDFPDEPKPVASEKDLYVIWQGMDPKSIPFSDDWETILKAFMGMASPMGNRINYILPHNAKRGFYFDIESLHNMGTSHALYAVASDLGEGGPDEIVLTLHREWSSDVSAPLFKEPLRMLTGMKYDSYFTAILYLFKLSNLRSIKEHGEKEVKISSVGWSMIRLDLGEGILRHGRYALPWFSGVPPPEMLEQLSSEPIEKVFPSFLCENKIEFMESKSTVVVSISDAADVGQIVADHPGRPLPQKLFLSKGEKESFPSGVYEGAVGYTQQQMVTAMELNVKDVERAVNACLKAYIRENLEE
ncbi:hypothetical protein TcBrA4_0105910 [Trypanosoma cruzi]|nr:hypothetical protein TcBrA4_0105910 [Trypanosoma cruzi]